MKELLVAVVCWVPRTRMHLDEIAAVVDSFAILPNDVSRRRDGGIVWSWSDRLHVSGMEIRRAKGLLDADGTFFLLAHVSSKLAPARVLPLAREWCRGLYMEILSQWSVLHADVIRGIVRVGISGIVGGRRGRMINVRSGDPPELTGESVATSALRMVLFAEACRGFIYSTTIRFRGFGVQLNELRERVLSESPDRAEALAVIANQRIEDARTVQTRLEISIQTIQNRISTYPDSVHSVRDKLLDLVLVAEHMRTVWRTQEENFGWVVQHVGLRVSIAERSSTRSFTAAVFSVALVALMRDMADSTLNLGIIEWSTYRAILLVVGCLAVLVTSYLLYLVCQRWLR